METLTIKIDLTKLKGFKLKQNKETKEITVNFPIEPNFLYVGRKSIYLNIVGFPTNKDDADYLLKLDIPKDKYQTIPEQERKDMAIIGQIKCWSQSAIATKNFKVETTTNNNDEDDLPF